MLIGVTSQNFRTVTGHAGKTRRFLIYNAPDGGEPVEIDRLDLPKEMSLHAYDRNEAHPVEKLDILVTTGCGEGFSRRMARAGVAVVITTETDPLVAAAQAAAAHRPA